MSFSSPTLGRTLISVTDPRPMARLAWTALLVVAGAASVLVEGEAQPRMLNVGDHLNIPAHTRHRVTWTDPSQPTIWLAIHHQ